MELPENLIEALEDLDDETVGAKVPGEKTVYLAKVTSRTGAPVFVLRMERPEFHERSGGMTKSCVRSDGLSGTDRVVELIISPESLAGIIECAVFMLEKQGKA